MVGPDTPTSLRHEASMQDGLREAMSCLAGGVCVVTTWVDGRPWGLAVSSCCSLSMRPVLLLVCLANSASATKMILEQHCFGVNVLGADQEEIARRASAPGTPKFIDDLVLEGTEMGTPMIRGSVASLHCELYNALVVGDHTIVVGEVGDVIRGSLRDPLIYFQRHFDRLSTNKNEEGS